MRLYRLMSGVLLVFPAVAAADNLRLMCTIFDSSDGAAKLSTPRPRDLLNIDYTAELKAIISSSLHQRSLSGTVSEHEIIGQWRGQAVTEKIYVNRYTSEYRYSVVFDDPSRLPTSVFGSCQMAGKPDS